MAVLILAIGGFGAAVVQQSSTRANQLALDRKIAANLARQLLEAVDAATFAQVPNTAVFANPPAAFSPANPLNAQGQNQAGAPFTRTWRVVETGSDEPETVNFKTIQVRIQWTEPSQGVNELLLTGIKGW